MTKRLALGRVPAIATSCLLFAGVASPSMAQPVATTISSTTTSTTTTPAVAPTSVTASVTVLNSTPTPTPSVSVALPALEQGRAAVLSTAPRQGAVTAPPAGAESVRPAVTHESLWPLVWAKQTGHELNAEEHCVAVAVYHEARGEPLDGQLAVAEVVMNRAASGRYPASWCAVVKQPWQFSFVNPRTGVYPAVNTSSAAWSYAQAIARIASGRHADALPGDVLWYHADYVAPSWGRRLARVDKIGAHIFYRAS